jgi:hypothetical protein
MIIINLKGGLGNQMFQYACGRALSLRNKDAEFKIDKNGLEKAREVGDEYRPYSLSNFNIRESIANKDEINKLKYPFGLLSKYLIFFRTKILRQNYVSFSQKIKNTKKSKYLDGYFQTEKYFNDFKEAIKSDFTPKKLSNDAEKIISKIRNEDDTVSIHIRRGDYVNHRILGGICTTSYYKEAIKIIENKLSNPKFYVFSNEIDWVKSNIIFPSGTEYISSTNIKDFEELIIMSKCKHNIIANSSFSWWAAWLNKNKNKIIIAPKKWAHGIYNRRKLRDIIPNTWIKI